MIPKQPRPFLRALSAGGVFLVSLTVLTTLAEAQTPSVVPPDRTEIKQVATQLNLRAHQQDAFIRIVDDFQMSVEAVLDKYGVDPMESRPPPTVRVALRSDLQRNLNRMDDELEMVLSTEQLRAFKQIRRQRMQAH